jgi:hypothetical protein
MFAIGIPPLRATGTNSVDALMPETSGTATAESIAANARRGEPRKKAGFPAQLVQEPCPQQTKRGLAAADKRLKRSPATMPRMALHDHFAAAQIDADRFHGDAPAPAWQPTHSAPWTGYHLIAAVALLAAALSIVWL